MDSFFSFISTMLIAFVDTSGGVPLSRALADFEQFPSKGFLSPQKLDLHVAHLAKTEPRYDRLGRGAVDPDAQAELVSQVSPKRHHCQSFPGRLDKSVVLCFTKRQCNGRLCPGKKEK